MDPYIGKTLDSRYEIIERVGSGGMAVVYKAKDNRLGRLVAVKILRSDLAQDEDLRRRFNAESQAVAQLSNPHIVAVYDVSRGGETEYIVMELIDGITLKQYMEKRGQLNWRECLHFITQIMRGLAHAHSRGIVHRDIKPQNIMVLRDGSVKVADFGIAVLDNASQSLTRQALGSVHYISPEQARGERTDARSDIYSAGIVLYEMLTGRLPFEGESAVSVALQHLSSTPRPPRSLNPDIPEQLELICMKAMAPDLRRRYSSAEAMIQDLEAFRKDPAMDLDFSMADLRDDDVDEPTRPLRPQERFQEDLSPERDRRGDDGRPPDRPSRRRDDYVPEPLDLDHRSGRDETRGGTAQIVLLGIGGVLALVLAVLLFRSLLTSLRGTPESYVVRSVLGYTVEQARALEDIQDIFEIREEGKKPSADYPAGTIMEQDPEAGRTRKGGNLVIKVWISTGEEVAAMPNVVHQKPTQAEKGVLRNLISQYELTVTADEADMQYSEEFPAGYIIASDPAEGEELRHGDTIRLIVSKGPHEWEIISFAGENYFESVRGELTTLGLTPGDIRFEYDTAPFGTVLSQDPAEGTVVKDGTAVHFVISRGPRPGTASNAGTDAESGNSPGTEPENGDDPEIVDFPGQETDPSPAAGQEDEQEGSSSGTGTDSPSGEGTGSGSGTGTDSGSTESGSDGPDSSGGRDGSGGGQSGTGDEEISSLTIALPAGRTSVHLEVFQNGNVVFDDYVPCSLKNYTVELDAAGESLVRVFMDGTEIYHRTVNTG